MQLELGGQPRLARRAQHLPGVLDRAALEEQLEVRTATKHNLRLQALAPKSHRAQTTSQTFAEHC